MLAATRSRITPYAIGLLLATVIAVVVAFLSEHYGGPVRLFGLLIDIAFHFLSEDETCATGIDFAAKTQPRLWVCGSAWQR